MNFKYDRRRHLNSNVGTDREYAARWLADYFGADPNNDFDNDIVQDCLEALENSGIPYADVDKYDYDLLTGSNMTEIAKYVVDDEMPFKLRWLVDFINYEALGRELANDAIYYFIPGTNGCVMIK